VAQSYCAVIYSFVSDSQLELAMRVFASMQASGISAYSGWLTITNQLYAAGQQDLADQFLLNRQPDWQPDADLYVHIIKSACSARADKPAIYIARSADPAPSTESSETDADQLADASNILEEMKVIGSANSRHIYASSLHFPTCWLAPQVVQAVSINLTLCRHTNMCSRHTNMCSRLVMQLVLQARGVTPGLRHMHPILEAHAKTGASSSAEKFVQNMVIGRDIAPDVRSFELVARVS